MFQIPPLEPKKRAKISVVFDEGLVCLEFFVPGFYQHLTELGQLN